MKRFLGFASLILSVGMDIIAQTPEQREGVLRNADEESRHWKVERALAESIATRMGLPVRVVWPDGSATELQRIEDGLPLYYGTDNINAAKTISSDKVWPGAGFGFSITGTAQSVGIWDGGKVRGTHQELVGRVGQVDNAVVFSDHATHVAGTMIAAGVNPLAKGMAYQGRVRAFDWNNDVSEMILEAASGLRVSNHSYGFRTGWHFGEIVANTWAWYGNPNVHPTVDHRFGFYGSSDQTLDAVARDAPYYLIVRSSGNDRNQGPTSQPVAHVHTFDGLIHNDIHDRDGAPSGYDCLPPAKSAKNILTVGAVNDIPAGYSNPASVVASTFHSWGPTDDGRIKPDIVGNGVGLLSSISTSDTSYASYSGTSMSSPNVTGSIGLLLKHESDLYGSSHRFRSSTVKALVIHTADEAGPNPGPDYMFGWGLMNTLRAAQLMTLDSTWFGDTFLRELTLFNGDTLTLPVVSNGSEPLRVTICWTDPPGMTPTASLNPQELMLVNDLDLRVVGPSETYLPWILFPGNPSAPASIGDNIRDNVEQVLVQSPPAGRYAARITHKGLLSGDSQVVSVLLSGVTPYLDIAGVVFDDIDGNGTQDHDEPVMAGEVILLSGPVNTSTMTDESGRYEFPDLPPGVYTVSESLQTGWISSLPGGDTFSDTLKAGKPFRKDFSLTRTGVVEIPLHASWNLVSVPVGPDAVPTSKAFPGAISRAFAYEGRYQPREMVVEGPGYWVKLAEATTATFDGRLRRTARVTLQTNWNIIGTTSQPIAVGSVGSDPPGLVTSEFFGFDGLNYHAADSLHPGRAYWVRASQTGEIILSPTALMSGTVHIVPTDELPPPAPAEDSYTAHHTPNTPSQYMLEQNYPNPFNPATSISFHLPVTGFVSLVVHDVLGQEVARLVNEVREAGEYRVGWDAGTRPSGVYTYRLSTGSYSLVKKMLLVR